MRRHTIFARDLRMTMTMSGVGFQEGVPLSGGVVDRRIAYVHCCNYTRCRTVASTRKAQARSVSRPTIRRAAKGVHCGRRHSFQRHAWPHYNAAVGTRKKCIGCQTAGGFVKRAATAKRSCLLISLFLLTDFTRCRKALQGKMRKCAIASAHTHTHTQSILTPHDMSSLG